MDFDDENPYGNFASIVELKKTPTGPTVSH